MSECRDESRLEALGSLRSHQIDAYTAAASVVARGAGGQRVTVAAVTPGGGKTLMASVFGHVLLDAGYVKQVVVVCPRDTLRSQVREGFTVRSRGLTRRIGSPANDKLNQRSLHERDGYVTTYQAIVASLKKHVKMVKTQPTLLVLDEAQHLADAEQKAWRDAIATLVAEAKHVLVMSGTLWRHDRVRIPFIPYDADNNPVADIRYTRRDALDERAILPVSVQVVDGKAEYWHAFKKHMVQSLRDAAQADQGKALSVLLASPEYRDTVLIQALGEWMQYRESVYHSRAIVLCSSQREARTVARLIKVRFHVDVCLAISDDGERSKRALQNFRDNRSGEVLVTVAMAHEGLDVPNCTHLICLTKFRSWPWLEQAFARITRFNPQCGLPWEKQQAFLYVPSDKDMLAYLDSALTEQDEHCDAQEKKVDRIGAPRGASTLSAISGETNGRVVYGTEHGLESEEDSALVRQLTQAYPLTSVMPVAQLIEIARRMYSPIVGSPTHNGDES